MVSKLAYVDLLFFFRSSNIKAIHSYNVIVSKDVAAGVFIVNGLQSLTESGFLVQSLGGETNPFYHSAFDRLLELHKNFQPAFSEILAGLLFVCLSTEENRNRMISLLKVYLNCFFF
jgi:hypothetical protein